MQQKNQSDGVITAAEAVRPMIRAFLGDDLPIRFEFWDGSAETPVGHVATVRFNSPDAIRRILWMPTELGLTRAYVAGELDLQGDLFAIIAAFRGALSTAKTSVALALPVALSTARRAGLVGRPLPPPPQEVRLSGWRHSLRRDAKAVSHHYDVGNDFYRIVLGPSMTYSCARFVDEESTLEQAQAAKHELVCRKLGLHENRGARLLDVGCGWGSMAMHAASHHGARVVGITISSEQAALARKRVAEAGLSHMIEIRLQDHRKLSGERFDVISSIGMSEHVGLRNLGSYLGGLHDALEPGGRLLNHAISSVGRSTLGKQSFVGRYVFPDGELIDVGDVVLAVEQAGLEVRDVESLREHYALTLRRWVANLDSEWDRAVDLVGQARARVWRLYMAGAALGFEEAGMGIHQVLAVKTPRSGASAMPPTRHDWN